MTTHARRRTPDSPLSAAMLGLEGASALDPVVDVAQPLMDAVTSDETVKDALQGRWLGHALHPLLVMVPLGAWISAGVVEFAGTDEDGRSTQLLTALGIAAAVPSAITGWAELAEGNRREKRVGVVHALANLTALGLEIGAWACRRRGNTGRAKLLSAGALSVVGGAGYLGGHLAVARGMGTKDRAFESRLA